MSKKDDLLELFRQYAEQQYSEIPKGLKKEKRTKTLNKSVLAYKDKLVSQLDNTKEKGIYLSEIMLHSYVADIVMLEYRNKSWPYDYMAFSRRIGEIWEPFCKLPFYNSDKIQKIVEPPHFKNVRKEFEERFKGSIFPLIRDDVQMETIMKQYIDVWEVVESGKVSLSLDLHFRQDDTIFNVDYKSGFGSNEKGNVNRLLQVGKLYSLMSSDEKKYKNLIFVRQPEKKNNSYLKTLKNSPYWSVYCAEEAYEQIHCFTGFDIKGWMTNNMIWEEDISEELRLHLKSNDLLAYLSW